MAKNINTINNKLLRNLLYLLSIIVITGFCDISFAEITIGSFNIRNFSHNSKINEKEMKQKYTSIATIIKKENFSILAIQEVKSEEALINLVKTLNTSILGRSRNTWSYNISPEKYFNYEYYAFIWNNKKVDQINRDFKSFSEFEDMKRPPYTAAFIDKSDSKKYYLVNIHIPFDNKEIRKLQVQSLATIYNTMARNVGSGFVILLGDFNLSTYEMHDGLSTIDQRMVFNAYIEELTSVGEKGYSQSYDHFCFNNYVASLKPKVSRIDAPNIYFKGNFKVYYSTISDHVPIRLDIGIDENTSKKDLTVNKVKKLLKFN